MGFIEIKTVASFSGVQAKMFTTPDEISGIKGIFIRGGGLSRALIESSQSKLRATIPCRAIATTTDAETIEEKDFCPLNWRLERGETIDITPVTSGATVGHVSVLWAESLSDPEYEVKHKNFNPNTAEPVDLIQVPDVNNILDYSFWKGLDIEEMKVQSGKEIYHILGRDIGVDADTLSLSLIRTSTRVSAKTMSQAIAITHGAGTASDLFQWFRA